jgi:hypothetical protein
MVYTKYEAKHMSNFYIKNKEGKFLPIELNSIINKDLDNRLIIVRVGTDKHPASMSDLDVTEESFRQADIINDLDVSVILTPFQIDVDAVHKDELEDKCIYMQITGGDDIGMLEESLRKMYKKIRRKHEVAVLPTPLKVKDYKKVKDILRRCKIRKDRRGRVKG